MTNNKSILKQLSDFISIESVSTDSSRQKEILKAVKFLKKELKRLNFEINIYQKNNYPPLIIAKKFVFPTAKTIGVYAHYDVQPEDPVDQWDSPPFKLTSRQGKLYGRGVADDKGHLVQAISAAEKLIETNKLRNNLVFIFEGEEEIGSAHFEELIKKEKNIIEKIDAFYVIDMGMKAKNIPQIFYGLRGIVAGQLKVKTGKTDLHSGVYGNRVINPIQVVAELLFKIKDWRTHRVKIPGFYDRVKPINKKETDLLSEFLLSEEEEKKDAGVKNFIGNFLSPKIQPSFEINGILSGYTGRGGKTVIPAETMVKFSLRLVPNQKPKEIKQMMISFFEKNLPKELDYELKFSAGSNPFYTDFKNQYVEKTVTIFSEVFTSQVYFNRSGGSIAAAEILQRLFKKPVILTGFTLPDENIHAPNENIDEEMFWKGIESLEKIFAQ